MQKELRRYSKIGDKGGILFFCKRMLTGEDVFISSQKTICSHTNGIDLNFDCALLAFEYLKVIQVDKNKAHTIHLIYNETEEDSIIKSLCEKCYEVLVEDGLLNIDKITFDENLNIFTIRKSAFYLDAAVFRNMLITFKAMRVEEGKFYIPSNYDSIFEKYISEKRKKITLEDLKKKLELQNVIGDIGEMYVLEYEKNRLRDEKLKKRIRRISLIDVMAGYDIVSFENDDSTRFDRYIEVKTYSGAKEFHWSKNEMDIARLKRESYYIYLVDYNRIESPNYSPEVIKNPYAEVVEKQHWDMKPDTWTVTPAHDYKEKINILLSKEDNKVDNLIVLDDVDEKEKYINFLPLYSIKAACGRFLEAENDAKIKGWIDTDAAGIHKHGGEYFVVQACGESMLPNIQDGAYCVFRAGGSIHRGDIVIAGIYDRDEDYNGRFTIKEFWQEFVTNEDGVKERKSITLKPLNKSGNYPIYELDGESGEGFGVFGVLVDIIEL